MGGGEGVRRVMSYVVKGYDECDVRGEGVRSVMLVRIKFDKRV